ncbi:MAG TPA: hypothetical protein G4N98_04640 [Thermoflexia bacterium]|nr:hypothetical protein [Thermoflexia bacterium]
MGDESICLHLTGDWTPALSDGANVHRLDLHNQYQEPFSTNWFELHGVEGLGFETPTQQNGQLVFDFVVSGVEGETFKAYWDSGPPSIVVTAGAPAEATPQPPPGRRTPEILAQLVRVPQPSPLFYLTATITAVLLGALHALTPGHGKTIVAAYLVGSQGTWGQAVGLGSIVTLTHTGSVLGLLALTASQYILPTTLFPPRLLRRCIKMAGIKNKIPVYLLSALLRQFNASACGQASMQAPHAKQSACIFFPA